MPVVAVGLVDVVTAGAAARTAACRRGCRHLGPSCSPRTGFAGCRVETDRRGNAVGRDRNAGSPLSRNRHSGFRRGWRRPGGHASECIEARLAARLRPCRSRRTNPAGWRAVGAAWGAGNVHRVMRRRGPSPRRRSNHKAPQEPIIEDVCSAQAVHTPRRCSHRRNRNHQRPEHLPRFLLPQRFRLESSLPPDTGADAAT